eukprot:2642472-Rhodomonas_salina.2
MGGSPMNSCRIAPESSSGALYQYRVLHGKRAKQMELTLFNENRPIPSAHTRRRLAAQCAL